ncbi:MAG: hypothetical protein JWP00_1009 [Chloroflexi bacterium]|jgi:hypothetical protein|nr:hypothetical protein [Chloroflexota bacterium]
MTDSFLSTQNPFITENEMAPSGSNQAELPVGEVVETSLTGFMAHTYKLDDPPPFGGLVRVKDRSGTCEIYGAVYHIATGGIDPGRRAATRGSGQPVTNDEQVYIDNPQLSRLLKTEFGVLVLGCCKTSAGSRQAFSYVFPDYPPPLHYSVTLCSDQTLIDFTQDKSYLRAILESSQAPAEELVAALLRRATRARGAAGKAFLVDSLRYLARNLKQDYDRFKIIVEKCEGV